MQLSSRSRVVAITPNDSALPSLRRRDLKETNMKILEEIEAQKSRTGLRIIDNPFDFGSCDVVDEIGKNHFRGDRIRCQLFINDFDRFLLKTERSKDGEDCTK